MSEDFNKTEDSSKNKEEVVPAEANQVAETAPESVSEDSGEKTEILENPKVDETISDSNNNFSEEVCKLTVGEEQVRFGTNNDKKQADTLDSLAFNSEETYNKLAEKIVDVTDRELRNLQSSKKDLKDQLTKFFVDFLLAQYLFLVLVLIMEGSLDIKFELSEKVIVTYITSVFVETLGAVFFMVKYAFNSNQEVELIKILNNAITNYQKYPRHRTMKNKAKRKKK